MRVGLLEPDIQDLVQNIRGADAEEIRFQAGLNVESAIRSIQRIDGCTVAGNRDGVVCIFGVAPTSSDPSRGAPWMLATDRLYNHRRRFWKYSKFVVDAWQSEYNYLGNYVYAKNVINISWLRRLGFEFGPVRPHGPFKKPFLPFWWKSEI